MITIYISSVLITLAVAAVFAPILLAAHFHHKAHANDLRAQLHAGQQQVAEEATPVLVNVA